MANPSNDKIIKYGILDYYNSKLKKIIPKLFQGEGITITQDITNTDQFTIAVSPDDTLSETSENAVQNKVVTAKVNSIEQDVTNLENKYQKFFDNINVSGSSLVIGSSTVATITGTTLHINQNTV